MAGSIVIMGATSGIGYETAKLYIAMGWRVGVAGRNQDALQRLYSMSKERVVARQIDVTEPTATAELLALIDDLGGMDIYLHSSGIGKQNPTLDAEIELDTLQVNAVGFVRMVDCAFNYFRGRGTGHIAVISSIAGTKGMGGAAAYSATKRLQNSYIEALAQLSRMERYGVRMTDIRPGFVATPLLSSRNYPMLMSPERVARHIVRAIKRKRPIATIDWRYRLLVGFWRLIPRWIWVRLPIK